jgi:putative transposase
LRRWFLSREQAKAEIFDYIETFYNRQRAHATLRYLSPLNFENSTQAAQTIRPENPG